MMKLFNRNKKHPLLWIPTLYFAQGLPYYAVMTISVIMYKRLGLSNTQIALYTGWLYLPWVVKPLWSPIVDIFKTKRWWTITMQLMLGIGFAAIAFSLNVPGSIQWSLAAFALLAFISATHDIASDGYYMLALNTHEQSAYVGLRVAFYRIATLAGQGGIVVLAGQLETQYENIPLAWTVAMGALSVVFILLSLYHSFVMPRPADDHGAVEGDRKTLKDIATAFGNTFVTFFKKPQVTVAIIFILLYKLPEAQLVKLINPFLLDPQSAGGMGFSTTDVGNIYGVWGVIGLISGGIFGGLLAARYGLKKTLHPMAWSMSLTCIVFVYLSYFQNTPLWLVNACVFIEQFGYGVGTTAFTLYLLFFSEGPDRTTHYALCTGFMSLGMMLPGMAAGAIQEQLGYQGFFIWTMICCIATIGVCYLVKIPENFGLKTKKHDSNI